MATSPGEVQDLLSHVERDANEYNMIINVAKSKVMNNNIKTQKVLVDGGKLEQVQILGEQNNK